MVLTRRGDGGGTAFCRPRELCREWRPDMAALLPEAGHHLDDPSKCRQRHG